MFSKNTWHHFFNLHCMTEQPVISLLLALLDWTLRTFELLKVIKGHLISSSVDFMKWHIISNDVVQYNTIYCKATIMHVFHYVLCVLWDQANCSECL